MNLIRIEDSEGIGFFGSKFGVHKNNEIREEMKGLVERHSSEFPEAEEEGLKRTEHDYHAFKSLYDMMKWITEKELQKLIANGFKVYRIKVYNIQIGKHQVLYKKTDIRKKIDITELF